MIKLNNEEKLFWKIKTVKTAPAKELQKAFGISVLTISKKGKY